MAPSHCETASLHRHRDVHTFSMNCNSKDIDHLGSAATAEPPLFSALAETRPAPVVEKQRACQMLPQELRCGITRLLHSLHCACHGSVVVKTTGKQQPCPRTAPVARTTGMSKPSPELTVWTITPGVYNNGHVNILSARRNIVQISNDLRIRVLLHVEATAAPKCGANLGSVCRSQLPTLMVASPDPRRPP